MNKIAKSYLYNLVTPKSKEEDIARSEFILNILLLSIIGLSFSTFVINFVDWIRKIVPVFSALGILIVLIFFTVLYFLSRKGLVRTSSWLFLLVFFLPITYMQYIYGVDLPMEILSCALLIIMTGVLINTRAAFLVTLLICVSISFIGYLHIQSIVEVNRRWVGLIWKLEDISVAIVILFIIATVSWLSNREIEKSLARARKSEADLKIERDTLELKVEERTKEIKEMQLESMGQLYRFAEFGKLSSGLFHDLVNPLTAVSLNMEMVKSTDSRDGAGSGQYLNRALAATRKMEDFITSVRKQISRQENKGSFYVDEEVRQVIDILPFKAQRASVEVRFVNEKPVETYGDNIKWSQVALNLISNAIDSYNGEDSPLHREVLVTLIQTGGTIVFSVQDFGVGIPPEHVTKLFEPFFTTKNARTGMGIGLSLVRGIIEKEFKGKIVVESTPGLGSIFTVTIPHMVP